MFAKRARSLIRSRRHFTRSFGFWRNPAAVRPCNDNQAVRLVAPRRPNRRPVLLCHWQCTPAGRLECHWASEIPDQSDEAISFPADRGRYRSSIAVLAA